jgi:chemotaxis signal transduction protein
MTTRAQELRGAFDGEFAAAPRAPQHGLRDVLCIRVGGEPYAIRLDDIASLHAELRIVALPTRAPELLGAAAIRATVVPIYDLAIVLGAAGAVAQRWAVVHRGGRAGFAFEGYDGHARVAETTISAAAQRGHIAGQLVIDGQPRLIVDLGSVLNAIETRWNLGGTAKDQ